MCLTHTAIYVEVTGVCWLKPLLAFSHYLVIFIYKFNRNYKNLNVWTWIEYVFVVMLSQVLQCSVETLGIQLKNALQPYFILFSSFDVSALVSKMNVSCTVILVTQM